MPEFCTFTGLTNDMLANFQLNKKRTEIAAVKPDKRIENYNRIIGSINSNPKNKQMLDSFRAQILPTLTNVNASQIYAG